MLLRRSSWRFAAVAVLLLFTACGDGLHLVVTAPGAVVTYVCNAFTVSFADDAGLAHATMQSSLVDIAGTSISHGRVYASLDDCRAGRSGHTAPGGPMGGVFYYRTSVGTTDAFTALISGFRTASFDITPTLLEVFGQPSAQSILPQTYGFRGLTGLFTVGTKLLVAGGTDNRVLIWNTLPTAPETPPDVVLGQPDASSRLVNFGGTVSAGAAAPSATGLNYAYGVWSDGTKLFVVDRGNHRVLGWNTFPTRNGQPADFVLGQASFTTGDANTGGVSGSTLSDPDDVWSDGTRLFVSDESNNRILVWSAVPSAAASADFALGQPSLFVNDADNILVTVGMTAPRGIVSLGTRLYVSSSGAQPFQVWNTMPSTNGAAPSFTANGSLWTPTNSALLGPLATDGTRLFAADVLGNRVLVWSTAPTADTQGPSFALGQPAGGTNLTGNLCNDGGVGAASLCGPRGVATDGTRLFVSDVGNTRVLVYNTLPTGPGDASFALGVPTGSRNLVATTSGNGAQPGNTLFLPGSYQGAGGRAFIADYGNNRVLAWKTTPVSPQQPADFALGQPVGADNLSLNEGNNGGLSASSLRLPLQAQTDGTRLFVADTGNNRVLVWNTIPTSTVPADFALGQPAGAGNLTSSADNNGGLSGSSMSDPEALYSDGTRLFVADTGNNRILVWNTIPTEPRPADFALGQAPGPTNLTTSSMGTSDSAFRTPDGVFSDGTRLVVADYDNYRALIWNTIPSAPVAADVVVGQPDFVTRTPGTTASTMRGVAWGHISADGKLYVVDYGNHRVLVWNKVPTTSGAAADSVIGQASFTESQRNRGGALGADGFAFPTHVFTDEERLFVTDLDNSRVLLFPRLP